MSIPICSHVTGEVGEVEMDGLRNIDGLDEMDGLEEGASMDLTKGISMDCTKVTSFS